MIRYRLQFQELVDEMDQGTRCLAGKRSNAVRTLEILWKFKVGSRKLGTAATEMPKALISCKSHPSMSNKSRSEID